MRQGKPEVLKQILIGVGVVFIFLSVLILGLGIWEGYSSVRQNVHMITVPGFHSLKLKSAGPYMGIYQHSGRGAVPIKLLTGMEYRLISKDGTREVPVNGNRTGDIMMRGGREAMIALNFILEEAGEYTFSAFNLGEEKAVSEIPLILFGQGAQGFKQSFVIGFLFFVLLLTLGIFLLLQAKKLNPIKSEGSPPHGNRGK